MGTHGQMTTCGHRQKAAPASHRGRPQRHPAGTLTWTSASRTVRSKRLLFNPNVCFTLLQQLELIDPKYGFPPIRVDPKGESTQTSSSAGLSCRELGAAWPACGGRGAPDGLPWGAAWLGEPQHAPPLLFGCPLRTPPSPNVVSSGSPLRSPFQ